MKQHPAGSVFVLCCAALLAAAGVRGEQGGARAAPEAAFIADLVAANRILVEQGVLDGYGHVSARVEGDPTRYFLARSLAPELVTPADILTFDLESAAADAKGRALYSERFIHGEIYKARPDVRAIVHNHSPSVVPFSVSSTPLRPVYHMAAFIGDRLPVFDIRKTSGMTDMLVSSPDRGRALAQALAASPAVLMRGHDVAADGEYGGYLRAWELWRKKAQLNP
jgi:HCOMODA/2-hydroxy-3-carboxy-muconic semialdehyde decarboxylase